MRGSDKNVVAPTAFSAAEAKVRRKEAATSIDTISRPNSAGTNRNKRRPMKNVRPIRWPWQRRATRQMAGPSAGQRIDPARLALLCRSARHFLASSLWWRFHLLTQCENAGRRRLTGSFNLPRPKYDPTLAATLTEGLSATGIDYRSFAAFFCCCSASAPWRPTKRNGGGPSTGDPALLRPAPASVDLIFPFIGRGGGGCCQSIDQRNTTNGTRIVGCTR